LSHPLFHVFKSSVGATCEWLLEVSAYSVLAPIGFADKILSTKSRSVFCLFFLPLDCLFFFLEV